MSTNTLYIAWLKTTINNIARIALKSNHEKKPEKKNGLMPLSLSISHNLRMNHILIIVHQPLIILAPLVIRSDR